MQARGQRYVRRARRWAGDGAADTAEFLDGQIDAPRGRRRRSHFGEHLEATRDLVIWTAEDEASVNASRHLIAGKLTEIIDEIYRELLTFPETAGQFAALDGAVERERVAAHREVMEEWLLSVVEDPLEAATASYLASVAHTLVRPRDDGGTRVKARQLLRTLSRLQTLFAGVLSAGVDDAVALARYTSAWCKRLVIHVDLFLAVYSATESGPHWY